MDWNSFDCFGSAVVEYEVRANAARTDPPRNHEVWLPVSAISPGDSVTLEMGAGCASQPFLYNGIPISSVDPPSTSAPRSGDLP